jgi:ribose 5-phosphate isomerase
MAMEIIEKIIKSKADKICLFIEHNPSVTALFSNTLTVEVGEVKFAQS